MSLYITHDFIPIVAIKTGRYTHEKKNRDIEEVKRLELQAKMKKEGIRMMSNRSCQVLCS